MTDETQRGNSSLRTVALLAGTGIGVLHVNGVYAAESAADAPPNHDALEQVTVFGQKDAYKLDLSGLLKLAVPLIDVPQSINTISAQEMQDRAVMDLNTALHTVPGVTIGAGEFRSIGTSPTIRGFVARTDMFMDGIRDYGDCYRDPFNLEAIEVLEGPAGVVFGRGSTGGVIEQDSKLPRLQPLVAGTLTGGTDSTRRATIDVNEPLTALGEGAAFRINVMGHKAMVTDRNVVRYFPLRYRAQLFARAWDADAADARLLPSIQRRHSGLRITLFGDAAGAGSAGQLLRLPRRLHAHANRCPDIQG